MFGALSITQKTDVEIQKNREHLKEALLSFKHAISVKNEAVAAFFFKKYQAGQDINFEVLAAIPNNEKLQLPTVKGGVIYTVKTQIRDILTYHTEWTGGATLTMHYHSDCSEWIELLEGEALVIVKLPIGRKKYMLKRGERLEIAANIPHQITALCEAKMLVTFSK